MDVPEMRQAEPTDPDQETRRKRHGLGKVPVQLQRTLHGPERGACALTIQVSWKWVCANCQQVNVQTHTLNRIRQQKTKTDAPTTCGRCRRAGPCRLIKYTLINTDQDKGPQIEDLLNNG